MSKYEWRKNDKNIYLPKQKVEILNLKPMKYYTIEGVGNPNSEQFSEKIGILYAMSYGIRMSYKSSDPIKDYYEYTVFPLEGIWDLVDHSIEFTAHTKNNLKYKLMIRQPDFLSEEDALKNIERVSNKKFHKYSKDVKFEVIDEGLCAQMMHVGSYDDESKTFKIIDEFLSDNNYKRTTLVHKEIYISDFRRVEASKLKTVLRVFIEAK